MKGQPFDRSTRVFGSEAQQRMQSIAHDLWPLLRELSAYGYEGRMIGIDAATPNDAPALASLARIQGASVSHYVPLSKEVELSNLMLDAGLATDRWDQFMGSGDCLEICKQFVRDFQIPDGYTVHKVDASTPDTVLDGLSDTALDCGVLPPVSAVLSGKTQNAVCFLFVGPDGSVAASSGAVMRNHPQSPYGKASWWGMLATREAERGKALSLYLGAKAALYMHEHFGAEEFYTGVRKENAASRHVCNKLGVVESDYCCLAILDPKHFGEGGFTK